MALVDADYKFIYIDIGNYGSNADGQLFKKSEFGKAYMNTELDVPPPTSPAQSVVENPFIIL